MSNISITTATRKILAMRKRIRAVAGGTSASKTISILMWLIDYCTDSRQTNKLVTVTSESYPHLYHGAILDFKNIMKDRGYWKDELWHDTKHEYTFETGNKIEFSTFDTYGKAHGSRRDILFINEGNNMHFNIIDQLIVRTREVVWIDWNPTNEFWFYTQMLGLRQDLDFITLTYLDNEALDQTTIDDIESHKGNKTWWTVYGLGQLGTLEENIYKGWTELDEIPEEARLVRRGLDFGYTNDPTVIVDLYKWNDAFIVDELIYQKGLSNKTISEILLNHEPVLTICDSAEPKSIDELKGYGVKVMGAVKGAGSVYQGIQFVQAQKIYITRKSIKTIEAYRNYKFIRDKDDKILNDPDDTIHEWSNSMDAIRYGLDSFRERKVRKPQLQQGGLKPLYPELGIV